MAGLLEHLPVKTKIGSGLFLMNFKISVPKKI